jgi:hypothetical protein
MTYVVIRTLDPFHGMDAVMIGRLTVGWLLSGWLVFGAVNSAWGQVELVPLLEDVAVEEDRYGGYEPANFASAGPLLLAQSPSVVQSAPTFSPTPSQPLPTGLPVSPPVTSGPAMIPYDTPIYAAPMPRRSCPPWRPCGPQESFGGNWWVKQGFAGADFRGACSNHDDCLMSGCYSRKECDRMFLARLDQACDCSAFPILCRIKAREYYLGVRLFGWMF